MQQAITPTQELLQSLMRLTRTVRSGRFRSDALGLELNRAEVGVLSWLAKHGECRAGDLACAFGLSPSVISRQLTTLEQRDLVRRRPDPADARAGLLSLTGRGLELLDEMTQRYVERLTAIVADWDDRDLSEAARLVGRLADRLAESSSDPASHDQASHDQASHDQGSHDQGSHDQGRHDPASSPQTQVPTAGPREQHTVLA